MILTILFMIIGSIPAIVFILAIAQYKHYRVLLQSFLASFLIWGMITLIGSLVNYYYLSAYDIPFFATSSEMDIYLIVIGGILGLVLLITIVTGLIVYKSIIMTFIGQIKIYFIFFVLFLNLLSIFTFLVPAGMKYDYSQILRDAEERLSEDPFAENNPIVVVIAWSNQNCFSDSSSCRTSDYENLVVAKNFSDEDLWVQMEIKFYDDEEELMDVFEWGPVLIESGQLLPVVSPDTVEENSVWDRWTTETPYRTHYIEYTYEYAID